MERKEAAKILTAFNAWRRYDGEGMQEYPYPPSEIGKAIDVAIAALETGFGPDWESAPDWAEWWAIDPDGEEWRYEKEPVLMGSAAHSPMGGRAEFIGKRFKMKQRRPGKE